jgi:hypothetical protein
MRGGGCADRRFRDCQAIGGEEEVRDWRRLYPKEMVFSVDLEQRPRQCAGKRRKQQKEAMQEKRSNIDGRTAGGRPPSTVAGGERSFEAEMRSEEERRRPSRA